MPAARAFENVVRFVARRYDLNVLGVDLGAVSTTVVSARDANVSRIVRADIGLGQSLENVVERAGLECLLRWLPVEMEAQSARIQWLNHSLHPAGIPVSLQDAHLMQAAARAALSTTLADSGLSVDGIDLVLLTGRAFAHNSNFGALALLALDALQPTGTFTLAADVLGLTSALGALAPLNAAAAAGALERDGFLTLGTVIAPSTSLQQGQLAMRVQIEGLDTGTLNLEVQQGSLELVPLPWGRKASIQVRAERGVRLGNRHPGYFKAQVEGGALGLIIDARGRPIQLPLEAEKRRAQLQKWFWDIGGEVGNG
jgi:hypothetical protein